MRGAHGNIRAHPERIRDGLPQPVLPRDVEVASRGGDAADLDGVDGEVGAFEGPAPIQMGLDARPSPDGVVRPASHGLGRG